MLITRKIYLVFYVAKVISSINTESYYHLLKCGLIKNVCETGQQHKQSKFLSNSYLGKMNSEDLPIPALATDRQSIAHKLLVELLS